MYSYHAPPLPLSSALPKSCTLTSLFIGSKRSPTINAFSSKANHGLGQEDAMNVEEMETRRPGSFAEKGRNMWRKASFSVAAHSRFSQGEAGNQSEEEEAYVKSLSGVRRERGSLSSPSLLKTAVLNADKRQERGTNDNELSSRDEGTDNNELSSGNEGTLLGLGDAENDRKKTYSQAKNGGNAHLKEKRYALGSSDRKLVESSRSSGGNKNEPTKREQVQFSCPLNKEPRIAILGGGMSGLICALTLEERGLRSTVFDTGKHGLGGRMGTRNIADDKGSSVTFDHAAQFFTVTDIQFQKLVNGWISEGAVREWHGAVGRLQKGGRFVELPQFVKYVASHGMRHLADHLISQNNLIDVKRPCWISRMDANDGQWHLSENGKAQGRFDIVVIAHNGKCANRLLAPAGVPFIAKQMKNLELSSIWALLAAFEEPLPLPKYQKGQGNRQLEAAFVDGVDSISWIANNTKKLSLSQDGGPHCWTFFSTAAYGKRHKVPQESIPTVKAERVKREMLQGVEIALGLAEGALPIPFFTRVQLWGAALPINTPNTPCIFDPYGRVGICGDWLLGSSLESAALSGMAMAHHIADYANKGVSHPEDFSLGLDKGFFKISGHDIGQFPGVESVHQPLSTELSAVA